MLQPRGWRFDFQNSPYESSRNRIDPVTSIPQWLIPLESSGIKPGSPACKASAVTTMSWELVEERKVQCIHLTQCIRYHTDLYSSYTYVPIPQHIDQEVWKLPRSRPRSVGHVSLLKSLANLVAGATQLIGFALLEQNLLWNAGWTTWYSSIWCDIPKSFAIVKQIQLISIQAL